MTSNSFFNRPTLPPLPPDALVSSEPQVIPKQIGPYQIETLLDRGGMSILYLASHPETQAPITIKVLSPQFLSHPEMTSRFLKEAEIIALADHPNIVKLYGYGEWEKGLYIAMEFIQGISLRQYLLQNPLSLKKALEMILEISYALCHLHTHGVIHRDVKPENVLVDESGHVKVIDFGISQLIDNPLVTSEPEKARLVGTPIYMSPEQRNDPTSASYPSDIYSLGIISYELLLGKLCHGQVHLSLMPKGMQKILAKALQADPKDRYLDIVDFIADVSAYLHSTQFDKEKKVGDSAGALFEKFHQLQQQLLPAVPLTIPQLDAGFVLHRPLGLNAFYAGQFLHGNLFVMAEPSTQEAEGLMTLLYLKGLLDVLAPKANSLTALANQLNEHLIQNPLQLPLPLLLIHWNAQENQVTWLSCGYGSLWYAADAKSAWENISCRHPALGLNPQHSYKQELLAFPPGRRLVICPLAETGSLFSEEQFRALLEEHRAFTPQKLAEALYRKAKSIQNHYFDTHPFVLLALENPTANSV